ncbi:MAG: HNH endonuclease [Candidatus Kaistia colombiensis]|nr:MAG: HNH endonuclease [Kaistia sp.]
MIVNAVFTTKVEPAYNDLPEARYHFPRTYLNQVEAAQGNWIVYYEPRRSTADLASSGGRSAYFAVARVEAIVSDPFQADHFYAQMVDYLEFSRPVPFKEGGHYYEGALRKADGSTNKGAFGRAVRNLRGHEFDQIFAAGFARIIGDLPLGPANSDGATFPQPGFLLAAENPAPAFEHELPSMPARRIETKLVSRPFRDRAFASAVMTAYGNRCAVTGIQMIDQGGRSEAEAAHVRSVAQDGPDSIRNGIAVSRTVHWMFDAGLLSVADDYTILVAKRVAPGIMQDLPPLHGKLSVPARADLRPHPGYLRFHRENVFEG